MKTKQRHNRMTPPSLSNEKVRDNKFEETYILLIGGFLSSSSSSSSSSFILFFYFFLFLFFIKNMG